MGLGRPRNSVTLFLLLCKSSTYWVSHDAYVICRLMAHEPVNERERKLPPFPDFSLHYLPLTQSFYLTLEPPRLLQLLLTTEEEQTSSGALTSKRNVRMLAENHSRNSKLYAGLVLCPKHPGSPQGRICSPYPSQLFYP